LANRTAGVRVYLSTRDSDIGVIQARPAPGSCAGREVIKGGTARLIEVGQVLDKYELLERVGQGGMAIVYRGLDRTLRRQVAVKVLHRHLAEHQEARDRFEREAQAVAKLRHENILEIFDYASAAEDAYIVTEFIDGATLKQSITDHPPRHAEIGAMIVLQIGRALAHAHGQGILHRDVKPENVMIRSDGVVKLTDFGISQMLDLQRMTVTGQLLGSPAYMSPEHVEGQQLDFRTDVFAAGIVLYQLSVGRLPFEGKNPHEILKRIGECKFTDPRQANPAVGNELGKIILRAMARAPDDRYPDINAMVAALERYTAGSGLTEPARELARYFAAPGSYEVALRARLIDHLTRRGKELFDGKDTQAALELFDRVLTLEPGNAAVLGILDRVAQRRRALRIGGAIAAVVLAAGGTWYVRRLLFNPKADVGSPEIAGPDDERGKDGIAGVALPTITPDAAPVVMIEPVDAGLTILAVRRPDATPRSTDAGVGAPTGTITVRVSPHTSEVSIGGGPWKAYPDGAVPVPVGAAPVRVTARNSCCQEESIVVSSADVGGAGKLMDLEFLPGIVIPRCAVAGVEVHVDGKMARLDRQTPIAFGHTTQSQQTVTVEFFGEGVDTQTVKVRYAETVEVTCHLP
jgi:serine/threonine-protein kinase